MTGIQNTISNFGIGSQSWPFGIGKGVKLMGAVGALAPTVFLPRPEIIHICVPLFLPCPEVINIRAPTLFSPVWRQWKYL